MKFFRLFFWDSSNILSCTRILKKYCGDESAETVSSKQAIFLCRDIKIHLEATITIEFLAGENFTFLPISMP